MKKFYLISFALVSLGLAAELSPEKTAEIEARVSSMGVKELLDRRAFLLDQEVTVLNQLDESQNPGTMKAAAGTRAGILAELSAIQKALIALVGAAGISALSDDEK